MTLPRNLFPDPSALSASFAELAATAAATVGVAIAAGTEVYSLGRWSSGVAWSTIKVPLAIAALRADRPHAEPLVVKAITESDNPASEQLWSQLGEPADAARQVQAVIAAAGDTTTVVESQLLRPGFTAFGQTQWPLKSQALFAANLDRVLEASTVIELMGELVPEHRWGLAAKAVAAKGGWGPGADGGYLARQFAILPLATTRLGVAVAADADTFEDAVTVLDRLADWLYGHLPGR